MSILDRITGQESKNLKLELEDAKKKLVTSTNPDSQWTEISVGSLGTTDVPSGDLLKEYTSWVYANVSAVAEAVADIEIKLYKVASNGEDVDEILEHPVLDLIHRPNQFMTKREFVNLLQTYRSLSGESPIRIKKATGKLFNGTPSELWPIDPTKLTVFTGRTADGYELITKYEIRDIVNGQQEVTTLKPDEVIFIKNINPNNIWRGWGPVEASQISIDTMHYSESYNLNFFKNSAIPFTVLYTDQKLTKDTLDRLKNTWDTNYRGYQNAYKTAILEAGLKIERLQTSAKDMDFLEQQRFIRDKLMAMFKTTKIALGITEDVNYANAQASEYVFAKNCIRPKMAQFVDSLNEFLMPLFDPNGEYFLDFEDPVPRDKIAVVNEHTASVNKWKTVNEVREDEGLPPLEGGDEIWQAMSLTPMSVPYEKPESVDTSVDTAVSEDTEDTDEEDTESEESTTVEDHMTNVTYRILKATKKNKKKMPEQVAALRNRNIRLKQLKEQFIKEIKAFLKTKVKPRTISKLSQPKYGDMTKKQNIDEFTKSILSNSESLENKMNKTMKWEYFNPQMAYILKQLDRGTKFMLPKSKGFEKMVGDEFMWNEEQYVATGIDLLTPLLEEVLLIQGKEAMLTVNAGKPYSLLEVARKYLSKAPIKASKTITDTAYTRVRKSLAVGIKDGEGIPELKARVIAEYESLEKYQADVIARTEVMRASNFATEDAFKQSGVVEGKEWIVTADDRLCEFCAAMENIYDAKLGLGESYFSKGDTVTGTDGGVMTIDYSDVDAPPLHPNCRCVLNSVLKVEKQVKQTKQKQNEVDKLLNELEESINGTE